MMKKKVKKESKKEEVYTKKPVKSCVNKYKDEEFEDDDLKENECECEDEECEDID